MKSKKGQLTFFITIAILVVITIIIITVSLKQANIEQTNEVGENINYADSEISAYYNQINDCLSDLLQKITSHSGNNKGLIEQYLNINAESCFYIEEYNNINITLEPPLYIEITERNNIYFIDIYIGLIIQKGDYTSQIEKFSFETEKKEQAKEEDKTVTFLDEEKEVSFITKNFTKPEEQQQTEIIIQYNYIPEDLNEFENITSFIPIIERRFLITDQELEEYFNNPKLQEQIINHSFDEIIKYNSSNLSFSEIYSALIKNDFIKNISFNKDYKMLSTERVYKIYEESPVNDKFYDYQWYLKNRGQFFGKKDADINIESAWNKTQGSEEITIAIIDQGIFPNNDYVNNILYSKSYNFIDNNNNINPKTIYEYHASHVTGIIASEINNDYGIAGICPKCKIINFRVADDSGCFDSDLLIKALMKSASMDADIISLSLGGEKYSSYEESLFKKLSNQGIIIVAAAGNDGNSNKNYPAAYSGVISVGATNNFDKKSYFSNYGSWVDIYAPGELITSACGKNQFCFDSGTSMAVPVVSGIIGLMLSENPNLKSKDVLKILKETGEKIEQNRIRVNAGAAIETFFKENQTDITTENTTENINFSEDSNIKNYLLKKRKEILENRKKFTEIKKVEEIFRTENLNEIIKYCNEKRTYCKQYCENKTEMPCNIILLNE